MPVAPGEHDGITGVTFTSDGHRLLGTLYLARGSEPKPTALLLHGCPGLQQNGDLAVALRDRGWNALIFHYRGSWGSGGRASPSATRRSRAPATTSPGSGAASESS